MTTVTGNNNHDQFHYLLRLRVLFKDTQDLVLDGHGDHGLPRALLSGHEPVYKGGGRLQVFRAGEQ